MVLETFLVYFISFYSQKFHTIYLWKYLKSGFYSWLFNVCVVFFWRCCSKVYLHVYAKKSKNGNVKMQQIKKFPCKFFGVVVIYNYAACFT